MYGPLQLKSLIEQRHEEALREANTRQLLRQAKTDRGSHFGLRDVVSTVSGALSVLWW
jgi:hypothetical protein